MEQVAVIPSKHISVTSTLQPVSSLLSLQDQVTFMDRDVAEQYPPADQSIRQLVSQIMIFSLPVEICRSIQSDDAPRQEIFGDVTKHAVLFGTMRLGGESRLLNTFAAAVGGHAEPKDFVTRGISLSLEDALLKSAQRELTEELYASKYEGVWMRSLDTGLVPFGIVCTDGGDVEKIHVGMVYVLAIPDVVSLHVLENDKLSKHSVALSSFKSFSQENKQYIDSWSSLLLSAPTSSYTKAIYHSIFSS